MTTKENPARAVTRDRAQHDKEQPGSSTTKPPSSPSENDASHRMALVGDALGVAARLIAVRALAGESAARSGDEAETIKRFRAIAAVLDEARDMYAIASGRVSP